MINQDRQQGYQQPQQVVYVVQRKKQGGLFAALIKILALGAAVIVLLIVVALASGGAASTTCMVGAAGDSVYDQVYGGQSTIRYLSGAEKAVAIDSTIYGDYYELENGGFVYTNDSNLYGTRPSACSNLPRSNR